MGLPVSSLSSVSPAAAPSAGTQQPAKIRVAARQRNVRSIIFMMFPPVLSQVVQISCSHLRELYQCWRFGGITREAWRSPAETGNGLLGGLDAFRGRRIHGPVLALRFRQRSQIRQQGGRV